MAREHDRDDLQGRTAAADDAVDVEMLRAELAEARGIARWLYDRSPGPRLFLGDVSEWPWLLKSNPPGKPMPARLTEADRDRAVLRAFAVIQAAGEDPHDAEDVADTLGLSAEEFDGSLYRLIHGGLITGGKTFSRSYVDTVTDEGMAVADMLGHDGQPLLVLRTDLASFSGAGYGTVRVADGVQLEPGQTIVLTDEGADAVAADVLTVARGTAEVRVHWGFGPRRS
jgi:hypothetical protein